MRKVLMILLMLGAATAHAEIRQTADGPVEVTQVAGDLDTPWGLAFLSDGGFLVTERDGTLLHFGPDGARQAVSGVPEVRARGQGGLLDVLVPADFETTRRVYLSYAKPRGGRAGTAVGVGQLASDGSRLENFQTLFEMTPDSSGGRHFGARLVEAPDRKLFVTIGERGDRPAAQDLGRSHGSVLRIDADGGVPADNPFVTTPGARPEIWSYGHRNPQGAALDAGGQLWTVEHGARGGDEVNAIRKGANYGWPVISYGQHYSGAKIGEGTQKEGMEQPDFYWDPSIAPSGLAIHSGRGFPAWEGDFLIGSLKFDMVSRLERRDGQLSEAERLSWPETQRVREVKEAPDGSVWFLSEGNGAIYRIAPAAD